MKVSIIVVKSKAFALRIIKLYRYLCAEKQEYVLSKQLLCSGTSIGANVREAKRGQAKSHHKTVEIGFAVYHAPRIYKVKEFLFVFAGKPFGQKVLIEHQNLHLFLHGLVLLGASCLRVNVAVIEFFYKFAHIFSSFDFLP